ncbi:MAG: hypothetical protein IJD89_01440 [Clostridia bacterium]|nr:hypothetical protein [Clostridia bacterium]
MQKKYKKIIIIALVAVLGVILILFGTFKSKKNTNDINDFSCELYTNELEEKIEKFLLNVEGIKNVNVIVTLDTSNEKKYAQNESTFDYITITSGGKAEPLYLGEIYPYVRGVAISCTNGDSDEVKIKITKLISAYLGISSNRIEIVSFG